MRIIKDTTGTDIAVESLRDKQRASALFDKDIVLGGVDSSGNIVAVSPDAISSKNWFDVAKFGASKNKSAAANKTAVQAAINAASVQGGVVWIGESLPCDSGLNLLSGVSLQGNNIAAFKGPSKGSDNTPNGACFIITDTASPFITIQGSHVAIQGISFYYPNQKYGSTNPADIIQYPSTIARKSTGLISSISLEDLNFLGELKAIDLWTDDPNGATIDVFINEIYGFSLSGTGIALNKAYDCVRISNCHFHPGNGINFGIIQNYNDALLTFSKEIVNFINSSNVPTFYLDQCDEFLLSNSFAYGTAEFARVIRSYGQVTNCSADAVGLGVYIHCETNDKAIIVDGFDCCNSGGADPAKRATIKIEGKGLVLVNNVHAFVGISPPVNNSVSNPNANSFLLVEPGGDAGLDIQLNNCWTSSALPQFLLEKWIDAPTTTKIRQYGSRLYNVRNITDGTTLTKIDEQQSFTFVNGWQNLDAANYPGLTFQKQPSGRVRVRGTVAGGVNGNPICVLPPGYRPATRTEILSCQLCISATDVRSGVIMVDKTSGNFTPFLGSSTPGWVYIEGEYEV